ncbi:hypothetical protein [Clostridium aminobutyricum]|uniref:DUF4829 domain-containing protein n=1 Tax=Clostridium aminobutyricum TaxID=33953 RepID=A0A939IHZ7_CLOAM|nr:hypothetical protein [Clostridium aminobutyricum]MBN7772541.1 hypothetical protein [Clostridium aminobutyricum]
MKKYSSLVVIMALLIIIISVFSGFADPSVSGDSNVEQLLQQRTSILQKAFYNQISKEKAEEALEKIETYPLITKDIEELRDWDNTEIDVVNSMKFLDIKQEKNLLEYSTYKVKILWEMSGLDKDYTMEGNYNIVLKKSDGLYKISCLNAI